MTRLTLTLCALVLLWHVAPKAIIAAQVAAQTESRHD